MPGNDLSTYPDHSANLVTLKFSGPSKVDWTKKQWNKKHAAFYTPVLKIDKALDIDMEIRIHVKEDKFLDGDDHLGSFLVKFKAGEKTGVVRTVNNALAQSRGFSPETKDKFWLVVTKAGKIKGNVGKGDDGHADICIEAGHGSGDYKTTPDGVSYGIDTWNGSKRKKSGSKSVRRDPQN
jgi:hypothetical protein